MTEQSEEWGPWMDPEDADLAVGDYIQAELVLCVDLRGMTVVYDEPFIHEGVVAAVYGDRIRTIPTRTTRAARAPYRYLVNRVRKRVLREFVGEIRRTEQEL